ncbi:MAG: DUF4440 domain-containing protein [Candidatus Melainabacteria bacterium]|nr:DUF4440 domain-containing protein [Candidatus Melainabacteria bacterium]
MFSKSSLWFLILAGSLAFIAVDSRSPCAFAGDSRTTSTRVENILKGQADCWNRGDLEGFMRGYLDSPETTYISGGIEVRGYQALARRYQDRYGNDRSTMGKLDFQDLEVQVLSDKSALCTGSWHLTRSGQPDVEGMFSLVLVKRAGDWKIIHDHTSVKERRSGE